MPPFSVVDLNARGEVQLRAEYLYAQLEQIPGAPELIGHFSSHIWRSPQEFETQLPTDRPHVGLRWLASADSAGIATVRCHGQLASLSLLACGKHPEADRLTLEAFQHHLLRELHDTGYEPAFSLLDLEERPLVATINFASPESSLDQLAVALADRCFAAAYFRYHGLA